MPKIVSPGPGVVIMDPDWEGKIHNSLRQRFGVIAKEGAALARFFAPKDTLELMNSIYGKVVQPAGTIYIEIGARAEHASFQEYGTGGRGRITQNIGPASASALRKIGKPPGYKHGGTKGHVAQPYLRPALISVMSRHFRMGT